jgi:diadenosine tetraphosphate (Ap4A) HIT family hydrolase
MINQPDCPFCNPEKPWIIASNTHAFAKHDAFPLTPGHTLMHLHIHLIPRHKGDTPDPRGGVRWIFPHKAKYWER